MKQHNNAEEYIHDLLFTIMEIDTKAPQPMPSDLLEYWCNEITNKCWANYSLYIEGEISDYRLNEDEIMEALNKANTKLIGETLSNLVERGDIAMSVGDDGEIYYQATEQGKSRL
jgi:hypothetical protein